MKKSSLRPTTLALCLFSAAWGLPLQAQQNPPTSRFNVKLGTVRAPTAAEVPAVAWNYLPSFSFTADGKEVFLGDFVDGNYDLFVATRANPGDAWGPVQPVGAPVNTVGRVSPRRGRLGVEEVNSLYGTSCPQFFTLRE